MVSMEDYFKEKRVRTSAAASACTAVLAYGYGMTNNIANYDTVYNQPGIGSGSVTAPLCVVSEVNEALENFRTGSILVCKQTSKALLPLVRKAAGLILEDADPEGQGVIAGMSLDIPIIIGAAGATRILSSGAVVTLNAADGTVSCN